VFSIFSRVVAQNCLLDEGQEWRNIAFFASLLVNPIETFKITHLLAVLNATLGLFVLV
jgi:hypothetical protein